MAAVLMNIATTALNTPGYTGSKPAYPATRALAASLPGAEAIPFFMPATKAGGVFDPLNCIPETEDELRMLRESELMHGRVAMVGALGYLVQSHFAPLFEMNGAPVIRHLDLVLATESGQVAGAVLLGAIFLTEIKRAKIGFVEPNTDEGRALRASYIPGDLGFDPIGLKPKTEGELKVMQDKEIRNGRLAMLAIAGMTVQELTTSQQLF